MQSFLYFDRNSNQEISSKGDRQRKSKRHLCKAWRDGDSASCLERLLKKHHQNRMKTKNQFAKFAQKRLLLIPCKSQDVFIINLKYIAADQYKSSLEELVNRLEPGILRVPPSSSPFIVVRRDKFLEFIGQENIGKKVLNRLFAGKM